MMLLFVQRYTNFTSIANKDDKLYANKKRRRGASFSYCFWAQEPEFFKKLYKPQNLNSKQ